MKHASVEIVSLVTFSNSVISLTMFTNIYYVDDTRNFSIMLIYLNLSFRVQELQNQLDFAEQSKKHLNQVYLFRHVVAHSERNSRSVSQKRFKLPDSGKIAFQAVPMFYNSYTKKIFFWCFLKLKRMAARV